MSNLTLHRENSQAIALPEPRGGAISIRLATEKDFGFIDEWQKKHSKMVGFARRKELETHIRNNNVLIAQDASSLERIGYCIYKDRYLKREELGMIVQLNVVPRKQRGLVGATLVKAVFDRCPYGVKLFCCWCAQDLEANHFWESIGFVPIAFRAGSRGKAQGGRRKEQRMHIFWQRRIREGDIETPYWFPSETNGGAMKEARIVLPIPPGTHWSDAKPAVLPGMENLNVAPQLEGDAQPREKKARVKSQKPMMQATKPSSIKLGGLRFARPPQAAGTKVQKSTEPKPKKEKFKNDPKFVAAARELRDRCIEQINAPGSSLLLPPSAWGKYDVSRQLEAAPSLVTGPRVMNVEAVPMLEAA